MALSNAQLHAIFAVLGVKSPPFSSFGPLRDVGNRFFQRVVVTADAADDAIVNVNENEALPDDAIDFILSAMPDTLVEIAMDCLALNSSATSDQPDSVIGMALSTFFCNVVENGTAAENPFLEANPRGLRALTKGATGKTAAAEVDLLLCETDNDQAGASEQRTAVADGGYDGVSVATLGRIRTRQDEYLYRGSPWAAASTADSNVIGGESPRDSPRSNPSVRFGGIGMSVDDEPSSSPVTQLNGRRTSIATLRRELNSTRNEQQLREMDACATGTRRTLEGTYGLGVGVAEEDDYGLASAQEGIIFSGGGDVPHSNYDDADHHPDHHVKTAESGSVVAVAQFNTRRKATAAGIVAPIAPDVAGFYGMATSTETFDFGAKPQMPPPSGADNRHTRAVTDPRAAIGTPEVTYGLGGADDEDDYGLASAKEGFIFSRDGDVPYEYEVPDEEQDSNQKSVGFGDSVGVADTIYDLPNSTEPEHLDLEHLDPMYDGAAPTRRRNGVGDADGALTAAECDETTHDVGDGAGPASRQPADEEVDHEPTYDIGDEDGSGAITAQEPTYLRAYSDVDYLDPTYDQIGHTPTDGIGDDDGSGAIAAQEPTYLGANRDVDDEDPTYDLGGAHEDPTYDLGGAYDGPQAGTIRENEAVMVWNPKKQRESFSVITGMAADVDGEPPPPTVGAAEKPRTFLQEIHAHRHRRGR